MDTAAQIRTLFLAVLHQTCCDFHNHLYPGYEGNSRTKAEVKKKYQRPAEKFCAAWRAYFAGDDFKKVCELACVDPQSVLRAQRVDAILDGV